MFSLFFFLQRPELWFKRFFCFEGEQNRHHSSWTLAGKSTQQNELVRFPVTPVQSSDRQSDFGAFGRDWEKTAKQRKRRKCGDWKADQIPKSVRNLCSLLNNRLMPAALLELIVKERSGESERQSFDFYYKWWEGETDKNKTESCLLLNDWMSEGLWGVKLGAEAKVLPWRFYNLVLI